MAEGDEQPLDTVGAVGGVQQIAPQADEHVAVVGEALDVDAMDRGVNGWIVLKAVEGRDDDIDARLPPQLMRIMRAAAGLDHELITRVGQATTLTRVEDRAQGADRGALIDQIDRRRVDAIMPVARAVESAKARQQPLAPVDAGDALEPKFDVAALDPPRGDPELPRHAGHRHGRS